MGPGYDKIILSIQALSTAERSLTMSAKRKDKKAVFFGQERANAKILLINTVTQIPVESGIRCMRQRWMGFARKRKKSTVLKMREPATTMAGLP